MSKQKYTREFLGTVITGANYNEIKEKEGNHGLGFHNKHLKAYLKGHTHFTHGIALNEKGEKIGPAIHKVQFELNIIPNGKTNS